MDGIRRANRTRQRLRRRRALYNVLIQTGAVASVVHDGVLGEPRLLSPRELADFVTGRRFTGVDPRTGEPVATVTYAADGTAELTLADGRCETGRWRLDGDVYFATYEHFREGREHGFRLALLGQGRAQAYGLDGRAALVLVPDPSRLPPR